MIPVVRSRLARAVALSVLAVVPVAGTVPAGGATTGPDTDGRVTVAAARAVPDLSLPRPVNGAAAVRQLGEQLDEAAALNDVAADELERLLREDPTAWLDRDARVYYREPRPERSASTGPLPSPGLPLADTFELHSNPAAPRKIFLDFDGATVSGTAWHASKPTTPTEHPAWDPAGDGPTFNDSERQRVQAIWAAVAEDFAPFDVDVTTEDPGAAGILRSGSSDTRYGSHALVSPSGALQSLCGGGCGGVAYLDVFGDTWGGAGGNGYGYRQPAWVFPQALGNDPKNIAEALSHEVGHNLSLKHDGTNPTADDYYLGHGEWAPIMGAGYYRSVTQWSNGAYVGADNQQDDVAALVQRTGTRTDEAGAGIAGASPVPSGGGLIATRSDVDTYALGTCAGALSVAVDVAATSPNLDARLQLLDGAGTVVATSDDPTRLSASLSLSVTSGPYYVAVDGVGRGAWVSNGYDDYGSLGRYDVTVDGTCGDTPPADETPSAPSGLSVAGTPTTSSVTVQWSAPADAGSSPVTGYAVSSSSGHTASLDGSTTSHTISGLQPGTSYTVDVSAVNDVGAGEAASVTVTTAPLPTARPGAPETLTAAWDPVAGSARLDWTPPLDDGGTPVTGYSISVDGVTVGELPGTARAGELSIAPGSYAVRVRAVNAVGPGPAVRTDLVVPKADSVTVLRAPRTARPGSRPVVRVTVTTDGEPAEGLLVLTHRTGQRVLTLVDGATKLRLPRQRVGRNPITATYHGDALTLTSLARRTIRVRRG